MGQKTNQKQTHYKNRDSPENANNTKHSKTNLAWFSRFLRHSARNKVSLFYNAPQGANSSVPTLGQDIFTRNPGQVSTHKLKPGPIEAADKAFQKL